MDSWLRSLRVCVLGTDKRELVARSQCRIDRRDHQTLSPESLKEGMNNREKKKVRKQKKTHGTIVRLIVLILSTRGAWRNLSEYTLPRVLCDWNSFAICVQRGFPYGR